MLEHVARELDGANPILALPTNRLAEVARALESLSKLDTELEASRAVVDLCRLLRFEAYALSLTADRVSHLADPAQLAYAAGLHNRGALRERSEEAAGAKRTPHFRLCWTTAQLRRSLRHRLRGHEDVVLGCAISADGRTGLSASVDRTLIVWDLATGEERHRLRGHESRITGCSISADGSTGLSVSDDQTLIVWDLASGGERHRLRI
jgi:WD40 repeat protein